MKKKKKTSTIIWLITVSFRNNQTMSITPAWSSKPQSSWSLLTQRTRNFMSKKKLFLLKKVPKSWKQLLYLRNPAFREVGYVRRRSTLQWLANKSLNEGWLRRLSGQANNYFVRLRRRVLTYRFKKQFRGLNKHNRFAVRKLFFPELSKSDLTRFFTITKLTPKIQLTHFLIKVSKSVQNPFSWVISQEAMTYFKYWWYVWHLVSDAITVCTNSELRTQLPLSTKLLQRMVWHWNCEKRSHAKNNHDFVGYKKWKEAALSWGKTKKNVLLPSKRHKGRKDSTANYYTTLRNVKWFWNTKTTRRVKRRPVSAPVDKKSRFRSLEGGCMYDYRSLHQIQLSKKTTTPQLPNKVPDINILNFRSFNWRVIT